MELLNFIGRFHPVVLHLPIGFLLLAFLMELANKEGFSKAVGFALQWGMFAAIFSAVSGWLLSQEGGYEEDSLFWHKWLGTGTAVLSIVLYFLHKKKLVGQGKGYFPVFLSTVALLVAAGHFGGTLTHGSGFLFGTNNEEAAAPVPISNLDSAIVFEGIIQPILNQKCKGCHNPSKLKGELLLTDKAGLLKGGKSGPLFVAGDTANSLLLQRLHLPMTEKKHMPPKGKPQATQEEIRLLSWWINEGADFEKTLAQTKTPEDIRAMLEKYLAPAKAEGVFALAVPPASPGTLGKLKASGIQVSPLAQGEPWLEVSFAGQQGLDKKSLKQLQSIAEQLVGLDLSHTNATDDWLELLAGFPHLVKLSLAKTAITGDGLKHLQKLAYLEQLNLYGTGISEQALPLLRSLQPLKKLYLWQTKVTGEDIAKLQAERPGLQIDLGADPDRFGEVQLPPPSIVAEKDIFRDTMTVGLSSGFKMAKIHYTLDGSEPDSTSSLYEKPLLLDSSTEIRALAVKAGWITSGVAKRYFARARIAIQDALIEPQPDKRFKGNGGKTLVDFEKGTTNFRNGKWLGYQGQHLTATLDLGQVDTVRRATVSALESADPWIFYPKGLEISASTDGKNFKTVARKTYPTATKAKPAEMAHFSVPFTPLAARYIRVKILSNLKNPSWHPEAGKPCWLFLDEIMVE